MDNAVYVRDRTAGATELISVIPEDLRGSYAFGLSPSMSADGRFVAFAANTNVGTGGSQIFVRDRDTDTTEFVSVGRLGAAPSDQSREPTITSDGRYVAFLSSATNLVAEDTNGNTDVFVRDRVAGTTELVSLSGDEEQGNGATFGEIAFSEDGRYVAFGSTANLVPGDTNRYGDVFVRDRLAGTTELISMSSDEEQANGVPDRELDISADGRYVAWETYASNLVPDDHNDAHDVFVRDRLEGTTERVSLSDDERELPRPLVCAACTELEVSISGDGRLVVFATDASIVVPGDTNGQFDVFVRDRIAGTTRRVSLTSAGGQAEGGQSRSGEISADGRFVVFSSFANNLAPRLYDDSDWNTFIRDLVTGTTELVETPNTPEPVDPPKPTEPLEPPKPTEPVEPPNTPVRAGKVVLHPAKPRAGRRLTASVAITQGGTPAISATIKCKASIRGRALRVTANGYRNGVARCSWLVPARSRGLLIRGSIAASTPNGRLQRAFRSRVSS